MPATVTEEAGKTRFRKKVWRVRFRFAISFSSLECMVDMVDVVWIFCFHEEDGIWGGGSVEVTWEVEGMWR